MGSLDLRKKARLKRKRSIRKRLVGSQERPRLCVFRSSKHIYAQVIDDSRSLTLAAASSLEKEAKEQSGIENKVDLAGFIGELVARRAIEKGIKKVVFDRNGFLYHGRVKGVSDGARKVGLEF
jgi:large subunit ribosomal protein L18